MKADRHETPHTAPPTVAKDAAAPGQEDSWDEFLGWIQFPLYSVAFAILPSLWGTVFEDVRVGILPSKCMMFIAWIAFLLNGPLYVFALWNYGWWSRHYKKSQEPH